MAGGALVLATWRGSAAVLPTWTVPKLVASGDRVRAAGAAVPRRLMKSRAELALEVISMALTRVAGAAAPFEDGVVDCGLKVTVRRQLAPGRMAVQVPELLCTVKSGLVWSEAIWMVVVPVLARAIVCAGDWSPMAVAGKLREFSEAE